MALASECRMRLQEYAEISGGFLDDLPLEIKAARPKLLTLHIVGCPNDVKGWAAIDAAEATGPLGVSTAVALEHFSSHADDKDADLGAVRTFITIGIDENNEIVARIETQDDTAGTTEITTTNLYKEVFHAYANLWGSDEAPAHNAKGNITIQKITDEDLLIIPATDNESNGTEFLVPDDHVCMLYGGHLSREATAADEGVLIRMIYQNAVDVLLAAGDAAINWIDFSAGLYCTYTEIPKGQMFEAGTWLTFWHSSMVNLGETYDLQLNFLIWKK